MVIIWWCVSKSQWMYLWSWVSQWNYLGECVSNLNEGIWGDVYISMIAFKVMHLSQWWFFFFRINVWYYVSISLMVSSWQIIGSYSYLAGRHVIMHVNMVYYYLESNLIAFITSIKHYTYMYHVYPQRDSMQYNWDHIPYIANTVPMGYTVFMQFLVNPIEACVI